MPENNIIHVDFVSRRVKKPTLKARLNHTARRYGFVDYQDALLSGLCWGMMGTLCLLGILAAFGKVK